MPAARRHRDALAWFAIVVGSAYMPTLRHGPGPAGLHPTKTYITKTLPVSVQP